MSAMITISNKQAEEFLNSGNETLRKLARDFFEEEKISEEFDEDIFADSENGEVISVHEIEVSEEETALVKKFKQKKSRVKPALAHTIFNFPPLRDKTRPP